MRGNLLVWFGGGSALAGVALCAGALWMYAAWDQAEMSRQGAEFESHAISAQRGEVQALQKSPNKNTTVDRLKGQPVELPATPDPQD